MALALGVYVLTVGIVNVPVAGTANFEPAIPAPAAISSLSIFKALNKLSNSPLRAEAVNTWLSVHVVVRVTLAIGFAPPFV
mgnify:FL=1